MQPPVLVLDTRSELSIYATPDRAADHLEAQDVRDGEYRLFDCAGVEYSISADTDSSPVHVGAAVDAEPKFELVRTVASDFLRRLPESKRRHLQEIELRTPEDVARALAPYVE
jgi:hypothetical protein